MRIGLVGYGKGGRFFHAPLISSLPGATFVGVVTRSAERRQQLAGDYPEVQAFDTLEQLVAAGVDAVVVSTPLDGRPAIVMQAIELGAAVVSDKPFALDAAQAEAMVLAAERRNVPLSVYQNRRWDSDFLTVRKLLASGALGQVIRFESSVERYSPTSVGKGSGGGFLRDLGSHLVDQALQLFGPVTRVYAELDYRQPGQAFDNGFFMSLTHVGGVISHLSGNCVQNAPRPRFRVSGSEGCYTVEGLDGQEAQALAGLSPATEGERWGAEEHRRWGWFEHGAERERVASERGCWLEFYQRLQAALQGDGALPVAARDALATTRILDAARQSAEQGVVVCLSAPVGHGTKNE
ncbi:Gfo/Idh/MocA family protein [Pseudomonas brassicacearum]|jgi:predicted dehydrogenase|uniref:Gfo/Idh/MocA family oxidoreductase n=1 Tax=Pseudomonas brassicacearum subsp. neoaurantiaca TaxID=494916 RepID=A0A7V8ZVE4_9PSED|nr:Gfo/Idh/MocA family oxidoreductase [Pseudomonas brassicacearum]MBA1381118.1 gfo/Idh/MocA family oxidoreductase [Pseudomonas brassicacearum subsp. neoaurantiaca]